MPLRIACRDDTRPRPPTGKPEDSMGTTFQSSTHPNQGSGHWYNQKSPLSAASLFLSGIVIWYPRINAFLMESEILSSTTADFTFLTISIGLTLLNLLLLNRRNVEGDRVLRGFHGRLLQLLAIGALTWTCLPAAMIVLR